MDTDVGYLTNTNMLQSLFGLDEVLWLVEQDEKDRNSQNELDVDLSKIDVEIPSHDLGSTFEGTESLFDEWMNTKIDFSSGGGPFDSNHQPVTNITEAPEADVMEAAVKVDLSPASVISDGIATLPGSASSTEVVAEDDCPTSPEQYVPNVEITPDNQQFKNVFDFILCNGTPLPDQIEPHFSLDAVEETMEITKSCLPTKVPNEVEVMTNIPNPNLKGKSRTPKQKERKRLQNRNAATRYRCKKRSEQDALNSQCLELEEENQTLHKKIKSLEQETEYLKNLIADIFQKKADQKTEQKNMQSHP